MWHLKYYYHEIYLWELEIIFERQGGNVVFGFFCLILWVQYLGPSKESLKYQLEMFAVFGPVFQKHET